jgi:pyrroline-5-carboxylate reductase
MYVYVVKLFYKGGNLMIGFIGAGNMANAMVNGLIKKGYEACGICIYDYNEDKLDKMKKLGLKTCSSVSEVVEKSQYVYLSIKPNAYKSVLESIKDSIKNETIVITMAAGVSIEDVKAIITALFQ